jgi:hypothetical protein
MSESPTVDVNVPRFNQGVVAALTAIAYLIQAPVLVAITFAILAVSAVGGPAVAPLTQLYTRVIRPRIQPGGPVEYEPARPPRFAQTVGAVFLGLATVSLFGGWTTPGWALTLIVTALAALAATTRLCVGCMIYERVVAR